MVLPDSRVKPSSNQVALSLALGLPGAASLGQAGCPGLIQIDGNATTLLHTCHPLLLGGWL